MPKITKEEWWKISENLNSVSILHTVDEIDAIRPDLSDQDGIIPPQIRDDLLALHQVAMDVCNGARSQVPDLFEKAEDLREKLWDIKQHADQAYKYLDKIMELYPESLGYDDEDESDDDESGEDE